MLLFSLTRCCFLLKGPLQCADLSPLLAISHFGSLLSSPCSLHVTSTSIQKGKLLLFPRKLMIMHTLTICFHKNFPFQLHIKDVPRSKQQTQGGIVPDCTVTATHFSQEVIHTQCKKKLPQPHSRTVPISEHYNVKVYMNHGQIVKMCWFKCILSLLRKINDSSK